VDEGSASGRVEIELTARDDGHGRRKSSRLDPVAPLPEPLEPEPEPSGRAAGPLASERGRLVATGLACAAIALLVGWVLGRAGDDGSRADDGIETGASTTPTSTVAPDELGATLPAVDPALLPTTVPERPPSTPFSPIVQTVPPPPTTPEGWVVSSGRVAVGAAELGIDIVGVQPNGRVIELDTATGELATRESDMRVEPQNSIWAGPDWILVSSPSGLGKLFIGHGEPSRVELPQPWLFHWQQGTDRFWKVSEPDRFGDPMHVVEVNYEGSETGVEFDTDGRYWIPGPDPAGGLVVVGAPGGSYRVAPDGTSRITTGDVITISTDVALATDCGEAMEHCGLVVVDRSTGESRALTPVLAPPDDASEIRFFDSPVNYGQPSLLSAISPDGRYSPILIGGRDQDYGVIDLNSGEFIQLGDLPESGLWWAPDGGSVMYLTNGHLTVFDFATRDTFEVSPDVFPLQAFVVRPSTQ
jgi:hypothetical protein